MHHRLLQAPLLTLILLFSACREELTQPQQTVAEPASEQVVEVQTAPVRHGSILRRVSAPGSLVARRESRIGPVVRGRIERVHVEVGDRVESGAPLFRIDPEPYAFALREAEAGLDLAQAERRQLAADLRRVQALEARDIVAQQETDRQKTALAVARARERQAAEAVALARRNLEKTLIRAPFAGSVTERLADEGTTALVQPQTIVIHLQETTELEARASIPESQFSVVATGDPVLLHLEGLPQPIGTTISAVGDSVDPATRTYPVRMRVPNPKHHLKAGVFAHVEILPQANKETLVIPRHAVRTEDGRDRVLVIRDGRTVAVPVELGALSEELAEVLAGVALGDAVVVGDAATNLGTGIRVRVRNDGEAPTS